MLTAGVGWANGSTSIQVSTRLKGEGVGKRFNVDSNFNKVEGGGGGQTVQRRFNVSTRLKGGGGGQTVQRRFNFDSTCFHEVEGGGGGEANGLTSIQLRFNFDSTCFHKVEGGMGGGQTV